MKLINLSVVFFLTTVAVFTTSCDKKEGCTDIQADNYDSEAKENTGCQYRYVTTIDISNVPTANPAGTEWDIDGSGPELKLNFGKNTSSGYDYTTNSVSDAFATSLTPISNIQFTNETWKYQLVDEDLLSSDEVIASGTFNPISQGGNSIITISNGSISLTFHYKLQ
jgi:hypothetical protein